MRLYEDFGTKTGIKVMQKQLYRIFWDVISRPNPR